MTVRRTSGTLLDCVSITREYGVSRDVAEKWMRQLPKVVHPGGVRKVYCYRRDIDQLLRDAEMAA